MRLVFGLVLIVGVALAGFAVKLAMDQFAQYDNALALAQQKQVAAVPTKMIYVSVKPIAFGHEITEEDVKLAPWPVEIMPENAFTEENPMFAPGMERRVALRGIDAFEALLPTKVSEPGGDAGLTTHLADDESAFTLKVDVASGVSGFLQPGNLVDVYWTGVVETPDPFTGRSNRQEVTKLIQSGVRLLAIDQNAETAASATSVAKTVTVVGKQDQAAILTHAQKTGALTLTLRSVHADTTVNEPIEVDQLSMLGIERQAPQPKPAAEKKPETCSMRERRGTESVLIPIPCPTN